MFGDDVVRAVCRHMNDDHADDCVLMVRAFGGVPGATAAHLDGFDGDGLDFTATVEGRPVPARVAFPGAPVTERAQVRVEVVRLYDEACAVLGVTPRPHA